MIEVKETESIYDAQVRTLRNVARKCRDRGENDAERLLLDAANSIAELSGKYKACQENIVKLLNGEKI